MKSDAYGSLPPEPVTDQPSFVLYFPFPLTRMPDGGYLVDLGGDLEVPSVGQVNGTAGWSLDDMDVDKMLEAANEAIFKLWLGRVVGVRVRK